MTFLTREQRPDGIYAGPDIEAESLAEAVRLCPPGRTVDGEFVAMKSSRDIPAETFQRRGHLAR